MHFRDFSVVLRLAVFGYLTRESAKKKFAYSNTRADRLVKTADILFNDENTIDAVCVPYMKRCRMQPLSARSPSASLCPQRMEPSDGLKSYKIRGHSTWNPNDQPANTHQRKQPPSGMEQIGYGQLPSIEFRPADRQDQPADLVEKKINYWGVQWVGHPCSNGRCNFSALENKCQSNGNHRLDRYDRQAANKDAHGQPQSRCMGRGLGPHYSQVGILRSAQCIGDNDLHERCRDGSISLFKHPGRPRHW